MMNNSARLVYHAAKISLLLAGMAIACTSHAIDLNCTGPHIGEIYIDTATGKVTKDAEESLTVTIATENSHYNFEFKGKSSQFKATVNRETGQITLNDACTPKCWGGPVYGNCKQVKAKF